MRRTSIVAGLVVALATASAAAAQPVAPASVVRCLQARAILAREQPTKPFPYERSALSVLDLSLVLRGDASATTERVVLYPNAKDAASAGATLERNLHLRPSAFARLVQRRGAALVLWSPVKQPSQTIESLVVRCLAPRA